MTEQQLFDMLAQAGLTNATLGEDNDGQIIIYTNLSENPDGTLSEMPEVED